MGVAFGKCRYLGAMQGQELGIASVPAIDSLSFTFLIHAAYSYGGLLLGDPTGPTEPIHRPGQCVFLTGVMRVLLDMVISPLAVRAKRWILGKVVKYPERTMLLARPALEIQPMERGEGAAIGHATLGAAGLCRPGWYHHPFPALPTTQLAFLPSSVPTRGSRAPVGPAPR